MFFCETCRVARNLPRSFLSTSYGKCEVCDRVGLCNDVPSKHLPMPSATPAREEGRT